MTHIDSLSFRSLSLTHYNISIITGTLPVMVLVEIYPNSVPVVSVDGINGTLSVMLELNYTPSIQGVGINTSEYGPLN